MHLRRSLPLELKRNDNHSGGEVGEWQRETPWNEEGRRAELALGFEIGKRRE